MLLAGIAVALPTHHVWVCQFNRVVYATIFRVAACDLHAATRPGRPLSGQGSASLGASWLPRADLLVQPRGASQRVRQACEVVHSGLPEYCAIVRTNPGICGEGVNDPISRQALEAIIGRAILDEEFCLALFADPEGALGEYEMAALKSVDAESLYVCGGIGRRVRLAYSRDILDGV